MDRCVFFNRAPVHYRKGIYLLLAQELDCDFYFGDSRPGGIKPIDVSILQNHFKGFFHNIRIGSFYWQRGVLRLLHSNYNNIITPGETYCLSTWVLLFLAKRYNKKVYLWTHGAYGDESGIKKWLAKKRIDLCTGAFLYGTYARDLLSRFGADPDKLHVIYNSLSYDEDLVLRQNVVSSKIFQDHFSNTKKNIVFIGRLNRNKKLELILRALSALTKQGHSYNLTLIGDGPERQALVSLARQLGLNNQIWFFGSCYDETMISELLFNSDVCVSPGNVGLTAMHAMSFGTPVISHNNWCRQMPEFEAIENGKTGAFFNENDVDDLAVVIHSWLDSMKDRETVRENCYQIIDEKYNPHIQIEVFKKVIFG